MSRHGKLSEDSAQLCVIVPAWVKEELKLIAKKDRRSLSQSTAMHLEELVKHAKHRAAAPKVARRTPAGAAANVAA